MGNRRNKQNTHVCDGKFQKRKKPCRWEASSEDVTQNRETDGTENSIVNPAESSTESATENSIVTESTAVDDSENSVVGATESSVVRDVENTVLDDTENTAMDDTENTVMDDTENTAMDDTENTAEQVHDAMDVTENSRANETERVEIDGARIVNISQLEQYINELTCHAAKCEKSAGSVVLVGERKDGLASIISTECSGCGHVVKLQTSTKVAGPSGYNRWEVNLASVWGQMCTGGGHATLQESLAYIGVPVMTKKSFTSTERTIGEWWRDRLQQSMIEAGREEREIAIERGDFHEGVPAITVVVDGGWSKRSHRHSYNAKSGVGIIVGLETKKILHLSVRNKYCSSCASGFQPDQHRCYRNWSESSSEMETSTIVEGFKEAEKVHGVRYMRFVGDGDSSVYPTLLLEVPVWGRYIKKLECANHACKCYRSSLEKLVQDNPQYKGKGGLTSQMRKKLTSAARCAIKMRSKEADKKKAIKLLEHDLKNGPYHCYGIHDKCSTDFCTHAQHNQLSATSERSSDDDFIDDSEFDDVQGNKSHV